MYADFVGGVLCIYYLPNFISVAIVADDING